MQTVSIRPQGNPQAPAAAAAELMCSGHAACPGCVEPLTLRHILSVLGPDTVAVIPPSCMAIIAGAMYAPVVCRLLTYRPPLPEAAQAYCDAVRDRSADAPRLLETLRATATEAHRIGLEVHAGHGMDYETAKPIAAIPELMELNIGHFLIGEAIFVGLTPAIQRMRALIDEARAERAA